MKQGRLVYEAHSTDYQSETGLTQLVEDHFCIHLLSWALFFRDGVGLLRISGCDNEKYVARSIDNQGFA